MKRVPKKLLSVLLAGAMALNCAMIAVDYVSAAADTKYEFESGTYTGTLTEASAASGGSYIFFENSGETATVTVPVETAGMYDIVIGYNAQYGTKTEYLTVGGVNQGSFQTEETGTDEIAEVTAGTMRLDAGDNEIGVECSWGWVYVDYVYIQEAVLPEVSASDGTLSDREANADTQKLFEFLYSMYGEHVISGQQEYYGTSRDDEFTFIENLTGELPVIRGFDFGNNCPLYAWDDGVVDRIINWVNTEGGIATASWHINVPVSMDSYTVGSTMSFDQTTYSENTDFVTANAMVEGTKEYEFFHLAVDNLAQQLTELQDAGVSLLFRPFHEAEGNGGADGSGAWFWWSKEGASVYVELYQYLHNILTNEYGLHNLIWEFNSYTYSDESTAFYPGRDYVDIIGYDKYNATTAPNESAISSTFYSLISMYDNTKMIALMENDTIPSVENMTNEGALWLYFMPWYGEHLMDSSKNDPTTLTEIYQSDLVITLDEFKEMYAAFQPSGTTSTWESQTTTERVTTTTVSTTLPDVEGAVFGSVKKASGNYNVTFDQAIGDTLYLGMSADDSITFANGAAGVSVNYNGTDYWVSFNWELNTSGDTIVSLTEDGLYNITYNSGNDTVEDASLITAIVAEAQNTTTAQIQVWWANDANGDSAATSGVVVNYAYILSDGQTTGTTATGTGETTTTTTTVAGNREDGEVSEGTDGYDIDFDTAMGDVVYLEFDVDSAITYANGCVGVSVNIDGTVYWASFQWILEGTGSGSVSLTPEGLYNATYGADATEVEDADLLAQIAAAAQEQTHAQVQVWWANNAGGEQESTAGVVLTGAYLLTDGSAATTTEAAGTTATTTTTESAGTTTTTTTTEAVTTATTGTIPAPTDDTVYGDMSLDGTVDLADAVLLSRHIAHTAELEAEALAGADVNVDGLIDDNDAVTLLRFLAGAIPSLPDSE